MRKTIDIFIATYLFCFACAFAENRVITRDFDWRVSKTEHFDIYYYKESQPWLDFVSDKLEKAYKEQSYYLNPSLSKRIPFFIYACSNHMLQNTIAYISDGVGGLTEPFKDRFMVWSDGSKSWLEEVITHEFAHEVQFSIMIDGFWKSGRILKTYVYPLWLMEGISEYAARPQDTAMEDMYVRDAILNGNLPHLYRLHGFAHLKPHQTTLAYKTGAAAVRFLAQEYGKDKLAMAMLLYKSRYDINSVLQSLIGLNIREFDSKFAEHLLLKYSIQKEKEALEDIGDSVRLTFAVDDIPDFNLSPVYIEAAEILAYISTVKGHPPALVLENLKEKKKKILSYDKLGIDNIPYSRFTKPLRSLSASYDGRYLIFSAIKNNEDYLCLYDIQNDRFSKTKASGFLQARQFVFSPNTDKIAFIGMREAFNDVYEMPFDKEKGKPFFFLAKNLTFDENDQSSPFYLSEEKIIFSQEEQTKDGYLRNLVSIEKDGKRDTVISFDASIYDAVSNGEKIYFTAEYKGFFSLFSSSIDGKNIEMLFKPLGGVFTPFVNKDEILFSLFSRGRIDIYSKNIRDFKVRGIEIEQPQIENKTVQQEGKYSYFGPYKFKASLDLFYPAFMFSSPGGLFLANYSQFSDFLGRHNFTLFLNYNSYWPYLNFDFSYLYWRKRESYFFQNSSYYIGSIEDGGFKYDRYRLRNTAAVFYPFDRYKRAEFYLMEKDDEKKYYQPYKFSDKNRTRAIQISLVKDNINGLYMSAVYGSKAVVSFQKGFLSFSGNQKYDVWESEYIRYFPLSRRSTFINRFYGGFSSGRDRKKFNFGGINGLRGYRRYGQENENSRVLNYNSEARVFTADMDYHMWYFFPDFYFKALYLKFFSDNAYAWDYKREISSFKVSDIKNSIGIGLDFRAFVLQTFQMALCFDYAIRTSDGERIFYFYLGPLF